MSSLAVQARRRRCRAPRCMCRGCCCSSCAPFTVVQSRISLCAYCILCLEMEIGAVKLRGERADCAGSAACRGWTDADAVLAVNAEQRGDAAGEAVCQGAMEGLLGPVGDLARHAGGSDAHQDFGPTMPCPTVDRGHAMEPPKVCDRRCTGRSDSDGVDEAVDDLVEAVAQTYGSSDGSGTSALQGSDAVADCGWTRDANAAAGGAAAAVGGPQLSLADARGSRLGSGAAAARGGSGVAAGVDDALGALVADVVAAASGPGVGDGAAAPLPGSGQGATESAGGGDGARIGERDAWGKSVVRRSGTGGAAGGGEEALGLLLSDVGRDGEGGGCAAGCDQRSGGQRAVGPGPPGLASGGAPAGGPPMAGVWERAAGGGGGTEGADAWAGRVEAAPAAMVGAGGTREDFRAEAGEVAGTGGDVQWRHVAGKQSFFQGHDDDVLCLAVHPNGKLAATGQVRSTPG